MQKRKAQVTLFVIVAIVLVVAALLILLYAQGLILPIPEEESRAILGSQVEPVRSLISNCVEQVSSDALVLIGMHAGLYNYEDMEVIDFAGDKVVVVKKSDTGFVNRMPPKNEIERQFELYMQSEGFEAIDSCTNRFRNFDIEVTEGGKKITADINDDSVNVNVDWPLTLRKGRARLDTDARDLKINMKAGKVLSVANDIANMEAQGTVFEGRNIDSYITQSGLKLRDISLTAQHYPTAEENIILLKTIPGEGEKEFRFYFAIERRL